MIRFFSSSTVTISGGENLPRMLKQLTREVDLAKKFYEEGKPSSLKKLLTIIRRTDEINELSSRTAAYGVALALKLKRTDDSANCLAKVTCSPPIIRHSLSTLVLVQQNKLDDALDEVEAVMNEEDMFFNSINSNISEESLDALHLAIQQRSDTQLLMKRFRRLQRAITQYGRRAETKIENILAMPISTSAVNCDRSSGPSVDLSDKIIEQTPHFLSEIKI